MDRGIPERIAWAVDILDVQPDDQILELGCGRGFAIGAICKTLVSGKVIAIDRSIKMVDAASQANSAHVASRKASIFHADLLNADLPVTHFDKIFLFNLNVFWMDPADELRKVASLIKPDGKFYIFHQPPPEHNAAEFAAEFKKNLAANGFVVREVLFKELTPVGVTCVISQPA
jgi:SAM-dependent methyltransferase